LPNPPARHGGELLLEESRLAVILCEAVVASDFGLIKALVTFGADVNAADYDSRTALHLASCTGNLEALTKLLELGADVHARDRMGGSPLDDAIREKQYRAMQLLYDAGSRPKGERVRGVCVRERECVCVCVCVCMFVSVRVQWNSCVRKPSSLRTKPRQVALRLCTAASVGDMELVHLLVKRGADPNVGDYDQRTALHLSASVGCVSVVDLLLTLPDININCVRVPMSAALSLPLKKASTCLESQLPRLSSSHIHPVS
jgi:hypothetical protein